MAYQLTPEELTSILSFVNGENADVLKTDIPKRFMSLSGAFQAKILDAMNTARSRCHQRERTIERMQNRLADKVNAGEFGELNLTSTSVALAIIYLLREAGRYESKRQVNFILYQFYARYLHETMNRPWENDRPLLQEWGPQFWGASNGISKPENGPGTYEDLNRLSRYPECGPMLVGLLRSVVKKYSRDSERKLELDIKDTFPYQKALKHKEETGAKWGEKISDTDLWWWKQ